MHKRLAIQIQESLPPIGEERLAIQKGRDLFIDYRFASLCKYTRTP